MAMSDFAAYFKSESDLKLENLEQRIDNKLDRMESKIDQLAFTMKTGFEVMTLTMENRINLLDKDMGWMKWMMGGILFLLLGMMVGVGIKWALHP